MTHRQALKMDGNKLTGAMMGRNGETRDWVEFIGDNQTIVSSRGDDILLWSTRPDPIPPGDIASLWQSLASPEARGAYGAIGALAAQPVQACNYLKSRLMPVAPPTPARLYKFG